MIGHDLILQILEGLRLPKNLPLKTKKLPTLNRYSTVSYDCFSLFFVIAVCDN